MSHKKPHSGRTFEEVKAAADRNWEIVKDKFLKRECTSSDVAAAMRWCNAIETEQVIRDTSDYLQRRKEWLIDANKTSGDQEQDENYDRLRKQYQELYGRDVKHA